MSYNNEEQTPSRKRQAEEETPGWFGRLFSSAKKPRTAAVLVEESTTARSLPRLDLSTPRESTADSLGPMKDATRMNGSAMVGQNSWQSPAQQQQSAASNTTSALASPPIFNMGSSGKKPLALVKKNPIERRQYFKPHSAILLGKRVPKRPPPGTFDPEAARRILEQSKHLLFKPASGASLPVAPIGKRVISRNQKGGSRLAVQPLKTTTIAAAHKKTVSFADAASPPPPSRTLQRQVTPGYGLESLKSSTSASATPISLKKSPKSPSATETIDRDDGTLCTALISRVLIVTPATPSRLNVVEETSRLRDGDSNRKRQSLIDEGRKKRADAKRKTMEEVHYPESEEEYDPSSATSPGDSEEDLGPTNKKRRPEGLTQASSNPEDWGWGAEMYRQRGTWKCENCTSQNPSKAQKCLSCNAAREHSGGSEEKQESPSASVSQSTAPSGSIGAGGFTFPTPSSGTKEKNSATTIGSFGAGGFTLGAPSSGTKERNSSSSLFSGGTGFTFNSKTEGKESESPAHGFKFGKVLDSGNSKPSVPNPVGISKSPTADPSRTTSAPASRFGSNGGFGFGFGRDAGKDEASTSGATSSTSSTEATSNKTAGADPAKSGNNRGFVVGKKASTATPGTAPAASTETPSFKFTPAQKPKSGFKFPASEPRPSPTIKPPTVADPPTTDVQPSRKKKRGALQEKSAPTFPIDDIPSQTGGTSSSSGLSFGGSSGSIMSIGSVASSSKGSASNGEVADTTSNPFGDDGSRTATKPSFGFGTTTTGASAPANGASFSFGRKENTSASGASKPTFSFGSSTAAVPTTKGGEGPSSSQPPSNGGSGDGGIGSSFSFGAANGAPKKPSADTPAFAFGTIKAPAPSEATAAFGSTNPFPQPTSTGFGTSNNAGAPSQGFGSSSAAPTPGPAFGGGTAAPTPAFGAGAVAAPSAAFGTGSSTAPAAGVFSTPAPVPPPAASGSLFTFGTTGPAPSHAGFGSAAPTFGAPAPATTATAAPAFGSQQPGSSFGSGSAVTFGNSAAPGGFGFGGPAPAATATGTFGAPLTGAPAANVPSFNIGSGGGSTSNRNARRRIIRARRPPGTG